MPSADNPQISSDDFTNDFTEVKLKNTYNFEFTLKEGRRFSTMTDRCKQLFSTYRFPKGTKHVSIGNKFIGNKLCSGTFRTSEDELVSIISFFQAFRKYDEGDNNHLVFEFPTQLRKNELENHDFVIKDNPSGEGHVDLKVGYANSIEYLRGLSYRLDSAAGDHCFDLKLLGHKEYKELKSKKSEELWMYDFLLPGGIKHITLREEGREERVCNLFPGDSEQTALASSLRSLVASVDSALPSLSQRLESLVLSMSPQRRHFFNPRLSLSIQRGVATPYLATLANVTSSRLVYHVTPDSYVAWTSSYLAQAENRDSARPPRLTRVTYAPSRNLTLQVGLLREKSAVLGVANHNAIEGSETSFATTQARLNLSRNVAIDLSATVGKTSLAMVESSFRDVTLLSSAFQLRVRFRHTHHTRSDTETSLVLDQPRYIERASFTHKGQSVVVAQNGRPFSVRIEHGFRLAAGLRVAGVLSHHGSRDPLSLLVSLHQAY